jgi:iron complex outermembrane receptor protein
MLSLAFLLLGPAANAQEKRLVTGTVRDSVGNPLTGISVTVKGTKSGTSTDALGNFKVSVQSGERLVFSGVGFLTQEVEPTSGTIAVAMRNDPKNLNEVVVTGFGQRTNVRKVPYSVTEIKGDEITRANNANFVDALQGKVAGVFVAQGTGGPSSSAKIRIRGNASLSSNTQPLVVIDGILIEPGTTGADSWGQNRDFGNIIKDLNPDDYESIDVLKGSAATALYGSRGLNGVLLITTKKGRARKDLGISFTHTESFDNAYKLPDYQNTYGGGIKPYFDKDAQGNDVVDILNASIYNTPDANQSFGPKFDGHMVKDIDGRMVPWVANKPLDFFQTGKYINTNLAIEGGNEGSTYRFSVSDLHNNSIMPNNTLQRDAFSLRATHKIGNIINLDASVSYTMSTIKNPIWQGGNFSPLFAFVYFMPRNAPIDWWQHNYIDTVNGGRKTGPSGDPYYLAHTMWNYYQDNTTQHENNLLANVDLTIKLAPGLSALVRSNVNTYNFYSEEDVNGTGAGFSGGSYTLIKGSYNNIRVQGLLNYTKQFGDDFTLNASAGGETYRKLGGQRIQLNTNGGLLAPGLYTITNSVSPASITVDNTNQPYSSYRNDAVYVMADLTWMNMLTANATLRNDWVSSLTYKDGHGKDYATYPAVGLAWTFTELPSFKNSNSILSFGKLRASLGWSGSYPQPYYTNTAGFYSPNGTFNNTGNSNQQLFTFQGSNMGNYNLVAERARELEFGADIRFFHNRLGFDVAWYKKNSFDQILNLNTPVESGASSQAINAGNIQNKGIEILMTATPIQSRDFTWNSSINFTRNRNEVISLAPGVKSYQLELAFGADEQAVAMAGKPYGTVETGYGYAIYNGKNAAANGQKVLGLAPYGTTGGYYSFLRSQDYDGSTKELGTIMENWLGSTTQSLRYKNFNLIVQIDAKYGGLMASASHQYGSAGGSFKNSLFGRDAASGGLAYTDGTGSHNDGIIPNGVFADGIVINGTDVSGMSYKDAVNAKLVTPVPAYAYYGNLSQWSSGIREYSTFDNSWIAVREVTVAYDLPSRIYKKISFSSLRVSVTGRNLGYLYKDAKDGINPEGLYNNNSAGFAEYGGLPYTRSLGFSVKAGF